MQVADDAITAMADPRANEEAEDGRLYVQFSIHPAHNEAKSIEAGRPIFEDVEYIRIMVPGDKDSIIHRPVVDYDRKHRFRRRYAEWKQGDQKAHGAGTPLDAWPAVTRSQVEELKHFGIHTVEALAHLSDANAQNVGPIKALQKRAADFLAAAAGNAPVEQMRSELGKRDNEIETLKRALAEQGEALKRLQQGKR